MSSSRNDQDKSVDKSKSSEKSVDRGRSHSPRVLVEQHFERTDSSGRSISVSRSSSVSRSGSFTTSHRSISVERRGPHGHFSMWSASSTSTTQMPASVSALPAPAPIDDFQALTPGKTYQLSDFKGSVDVIGHPVWSP